MPKFNVTFNPVGKVVSVDPSEFPYGSHGLPGSLLDIALANDIAIECACGGVGVCGTCHVIVETGAQNLSETGDDEFDTLDQVPANTLDSRLACLAIAQGDVTVTIPNWNRNAVSEHG
ncbi:MAG: 2Fe-2S iron-sulfur cluster binding domain-containing protein [bacterium]|nr:2Fe-2S iron-sulfur cluster binding domain-containing protein [bacterium]